MVTPFKRRATQPGGMDRRSRMGSYCLASPKGSRNNNFTFLGVEAPDWQGARSANGHSIQATSNAARRDGSAFKNGELLFREP